MELNDRDGSCSHRSIMYEKHVDFPVTSCAGNITYDPPDAGVVLILELNVEMVVGRLPTSGSKQCSGSPRTL